MAYASLKDYGVIGNQHSAVLISRLGSVDWCCLPYLDSPSHFASLLDENQGGLFQIAPVGEYHSEQHYVSRTHVLETHFETSEGKGKITDWMPMDQKKPLVRRKVEVEEGQIEWCLNCSPRFGYGAESVQLEKKRQGILFRGTVPEDVAQLYASIPLHEDLQGKSATAVFSLNAGEKAHFTWAWGRMDRPAIEAEPTETIKYWRSQIHECPKDSGRCLFSGPWHEMVVRSGLTLKLLTNSYAGSLAGAATTSLPSILGGTRNWDYRYSWVRDVSLSIQAFLNLGYEKEANRLFRWLTDIVIRDGAEELQGVYTFDGGKFLPERELTYLGGYAGSRPVRVGNHSARQYHLDIYGHVSVSALQFFQRTGYLPTGLWTRLKEITEYVCQAWRRPDRGAWESRAKPEHFLASKVLCWVAIDRAIWLATQMGEDIPQRWTQEREVLHQTICDQGFDENRRSFVRSFGEREIDSAALMIPLVGFLPPDDYRVLSTLEVIQSELSDGVLIHRQQTPDGLRGDEGGSLQSSFMFIAALALCGRVEEASDRLAELCTYATPLGLYAEAVDPMAGTPSGNFPCTSSHLGLINAALYVGMARGRAVPTGSLIGSLTREPLKRAA